MKKLTIANNPTIQEAITAATILENWLQRNNYGARRPKWLEIIRDTRHEIQEIRDNPREN